jgi:predicted Fe-Mo cluster-binding NifX family protein
MSSQTLRVAVASKEGRAVSEHFGHAKVFHIYDVVDQACRLVAVRHVDHYCLGGHSDKNAMAGILQAVSDCQAVFVAKIGDGPTDKLRARGIEAVSDYAWEEIEPSLLAYAARRNA